ncbi:zinc finger protein 142-like isoform X1 [Zophobas morio]|uniref:zinc finger protein 142-like isoform X1 n=1 Tax=Zophobas morio TaxID=2755281 RepID=UPI003082CF9E
MEPPLVNVHDCKICPYVTTSFFLMMNHIRRHQSPLVPFNCENPLDSYHCKHCSFQTELTLLFKQHIRKHHGIKHENDDLIVQHNNQKYVCEKCGFETHFTLKWLCHIRECQQSKGQPNSKRNINARHVDDLDAKWYKCKQCSFRCKRKSSLLGHMKICHLKEENDKWNECQQGPDKTRDCSNLRSDGRSQHLDGKSITWYQCNECPVKTRDKRVLQKHVKARHSNGHRGIKCYNCEKCQFKTKY